MITFDINGNPQPFGIVKILLSDFKSIYVDAFTTSSTRQSIYFKWQDYIEHFKNQICSEFKQWVNGSYTTNKIDPNDIDLVNLVEYTDDLNSKAHLIVNFLTQGGSKDKYKVDGYFVQIYSTDDPRYSLTEHWLNYWKDWFGHDRERREKGIPEISF